MFCGGSSRCVPCTSFTTSSGRSSIGAGPRAFCKMKPSFAKYERANRMDRPPVLKDDLRLSWLSPAWEGPLKKSDLLRGPHMNCMGGSWSDAKISARVAQAAADKLRVPQRRGGFYWIISRKNNPEPLGMIGFHTQSDPACPMFIQRSVLHASLSFQEKSRCLQMCLQKFAVLRPDQNIVWMHRQGRTGGETLRAAGFVTLYQNVPMERRNRKKTRRMDVLAIDLNMFRAKWRFRPAG